MSWLTAVTGKAEDFLNRLDKSAAEAFHADEDELGKEQTGGLSSLSSVDPTTLTSVPSYSRQLSSSQSVPSRLHKLNPDSTMPPATSTNVPATSANVPATSTPKSVLKTAPTSVMKSTVSAGKPGVKRNSDEALFDFLNSKDSAEAVKKPLTPGSSGHSRQSSTSSTRGISKTSDVALEASSTVTAAITSETADSQSGSRQDSPTNSHASADLDALADAMQESLPISEQHAHDVHTSVGGDTHLSSLELENRLLRNEIASLNQEMASVIQRAKDSQTELVRTKEKMANYMNSASLHDQMVRELQAREADLHEALKAKDSQLAVLRVRLEDADRNISEHKKETDRLQTEKERILKDQSSASGLHSQSLDTMRHKLNEMEDIMSRERQAHKNFQQEAAERQSRLEQEQKVLAEALTAAEKKMVDEKVKAAEAYTQLKTMKMTLEATRQEMAEYKDKASRILQSKERLISSLREGSAISGTSDGVSSLEYESIKQERDMLREELQQSKMTVEHLRLELQELETQLQQETDTAQENFRSLEGSFAEEKRRRLEAEQELLSQKQELQYSIDELHRQKVSFQSRISDREAEIERLRNQLTTKSISSTTESELEARVRSLTESLIQKQTMLEALSTEKNSLTLQLERLGLQDRRKSKQQYRDVENSLMRTTIASVSVGDHDDEVRQRLPMFMKEGATDTEVTRKMKHYVNSIDRFSIRLGVFLRRYPIARIFVIVYMALLHMWVMIVLMTYQPEIHGPENMPGPPQK